MTKSEIRNAFDEAMKANLEQERQLAKLLKEANTEIAIALEWYEFTKYLFEKGHESFANNEMDFDTFCEYIELVESAEIELKEAQIKAERLENAMVKLDESYCEMYTAMKK